MVRLKRSATSARPTDSLGETQKALEKYNEALPLREQGDRIGKLAHSVTSAWPTTPLGEMRKALEKFNEALPIERGPWVTAGVKPYTQCTSTRPIMWLGDMQKALEKFNEAPPIFRAMGDRRGRLKHLTTSAKFTRHWRRRRGAGEVQRGLADHTGGR